MEADDSASTGAARTSDPKASERPPRREMIWNASGLSDLPLSSICQNYDALVLKNDSVQLPRRFGANFIEYQPACSCKGYIREEITLTPDALQNMVIIYQQPSPNERCSMCGELLCKITEEVNIRLNS